jgi:glycosyltransferase involved in cell wall biosynthesis
VQRPIRVLAIMEAAFVTGPAKNLIEFGQRARVGHGSLPSVQLSIVSYQRGLAEENPFIMAARANGIPVDVIRERGRFDTGVLRQLRTIVAQRNPDIIQTHNIKSHFLIRISGLWRSHVWLGFHHGYTTTDFKMRCYNQLDRWSLRAARHIMTVCQAFAEELAAKGLQRHRITVRHNSVTPFPSVDSQAVRQLRESLAGSDTSVLLSVGRLSIEKGHVDLVRALGQLRRQWPDDSIQLAIVGEGPERPRILAASIEEGIADRVTLTGLKSDVRPYYAIADLVVIPSHSEGSPNSLLEAMAAGVPVVATRVGGIPEIVTDQETALLVNRHDIGALAVAIHRLLEDSQTRRRLADRARAVALAQYSPEAYQRILLELYQRLLKESTEAGRSS